LKLLIKKRLRNHKKTIKTINRMVLRSKKRSYEKILFGMKSDPEYIERQMLSSKTHYYKHREEVLERIETYQRIH
jgi:hypothetical protein